MACCGCDTKRSPVSFCTCTVWVKRTPREKTFVFGVGFPDGILQLIKKKYISQKIGNFNPVESDLLKHWSFGEIKHLLLTVEKANYWEKFCWNGAPADCCENKFYEWLEPSALDCIILHRLILNMDWSFMCRESGDAFHPFSSSPYSLIEVLQLSKKTGFFSPDKKQCTQQLLR